jgi:hypothetical protein
VFFKERKLNGIEIPRKGLSEPNFGAYVSPWTSPFVLDTK